MVHKFLYGKTPINKQDLIILLRKMRLPENGCILEAETFALNNGTFINGT